MTQMSRKIITEELFQEMYNDYKNGFSSSQIAEKYGFKKGTIASHFNKRGFYWSTAKKFSVEEIDNIIMDYNNGMKPFELAKKYHRNSATIIDKLKSIGIYKRSTYRFTNEDIEFLKVHYPLGDWENIEKRFSNTTKASILKKVSKLGIKAESFYENRWTEKEILILKKYYCDGDMDKVLNLLPNRSYDSIVTKAQRLNLKTRDYWSEEEINIMKKYYHIKTVDEMMELLPKRTRNSIITQAMKLHLSSVCKYNEEETNFIIKNWKTMSDREIGIRLNKPHRGIIAKRLLLGLLREKEESSYNDLSEYVRRNNLDWKTKSMINCNYRCILTGNRFTDIHHIYGLNLILNETLSELNIEIKDNMNNYTDEELRIILDVFRKKQSKYPLGVCLSKPVHILFHNKYGYGNNTPEQWNEFVFEFKNGKYNKILNVA